MQSSLHHEADQRLQSEPMESGRYRDLFYSPNRKGHILPPTSATLAVVNEAIDAIVNDINQQTESLELLDEEEKYEQAEIDEVQAKIDSECERKQRLCNEIEAMESDGKGSDQQTTKLREAVDECSRRIQSLEYEYDLIKTRAHRPAYYFRDEFRQTVARCLQLWNDELTQLARIHQRLVRKIKTDPQQRQQLKQLEKINKEWDVIAKPRQPALIIAKPIDRQIDTETIGRRVYLIRNAERVQDVFPNWLNECFIGPNRVYVTGDANMPREIPERRQHPDDFFHDPPITEMGRSLASLVGAALQSRDGDRAFFFVLSPSLYCLQTAFAIKEGASMEDNKVAVEPGLFEDFHLEVNDDGTTLAPSFFNAADFKSLGGDLNFVSDNYRQSITLQAVKTLKMQNETAEGSSKRQIAALAHAVKQAPADASVVIVAHPATLQAIDSFLGPRIPLPDTSTAKDLLGLDYSYLSVVAFHETTTGRWERIADPLPPFNRRPLTNATRALNNDGQK